MVGRQPLTDEHRRLVRLDVGCIGLIQPGFFRSLLSENDFEALVPLVPRKLPEIRTILFGRFPYKSL